MKLKYKENILYKIAGSVYILLSLMYLGVMYFLFKDKQIYFNRFIIFIFSFIPLNFVVGAYYFKLHTIDYVRLNDNELSIYKSLILPRKKLNISEIEQGRIIGEKLILILKNGKEVAISFKLLTITDSENLLIKLKEFFLIEQAFVK